MARFKSAIVEQGSGKLDGIVFTHGRYGPQIRQRAKAANVNTVAQATHRGQFRIAASAWKALTAAQRTSWAAYAEQLKLRDRKLGGTTAMSPIAMYIRAATVAAQLGQPLPSFAPTDHSALVFPLPALTANAGSTALHWPAGPLPANLVILIYTSPCMSAGTSAYSGKMLHLANVTSATLAAGYNLTLPIAPEPGQKLYVKLVAFELNSARVSDTRQSIILVTAGPAHGVAVFDTPGIHTWTVPAGVVSVSYLVVAGGGGGGYGDAAGGGGGAGGFLHSNVYAVSPAAVLTVVVANGGDAQLTGEDSQFDAVIAHGGGAGATISSPAQTGGCGGGGNQTPPYNTGAPAIPGEGYAGGDGSGTYTQAAGGGGGGMGGPGVNGAPLTGAGGNGGDGRLIVIGGVGFTVGGGGGGAGLFIAGLGGSGGGGFGGTNADPGSPGSPNTGGGGGGGGDYTYDSSAGGSGLVVIAW